MFHPQPHGKGFALQRYTPFGQQFVGVAGAVADRQDQAVAGQLLPVVDDQRGNGTVPYDDVAQAAAEADREAALQQMLPDGAHHEPQAVGADMRLGQVADFGRGPEIGQPLQYPGHQRVFGAAGQLAVGKGPGPPLAELDIALRVEQAVPPELLDIQSALFHRLAAFDDRGGQAVFGQAQGGKQAGRAAAGDDDPPVSATGGETIRLLVPVATPVRESGEPGAEAPWYPPA